MKPFFERLMLLVQSLVTIFSGQLLWRKKILNFRQQSFAFSLLSPLEKEVDTFLEGRETLYLTCLVLLKMAQ